MSKKTRDIQTGGSAFPGVDPDTQHSTSGMTLRDYFASQALAKLAVKDDIGSEPAHIAKDCYKLADAMLKERSK